MRKVSKKLIMSVLTLVLTVIALGTTTFAWFSLSTISNVSNISGQVTAGDGLEVRLTSGAFETPWKSNLSQSDVSTFITSVYAANRLTAVTTTDPTGTFKKAAQTDNGNIWIDGADATANTDYLDFKVEFRSRATGNVALTSLDITGTPGTVTIDGDAYEQIYGDVAAKDNVLANPANAARVSFNDIVFQLTGNKPAVNGDPAVEGNHFMADEDAINAGQWDFLRTSKGLKFFTTKEEHDGNPLNSTEVTAAPAGKMAKALDNTHAPSLATVTVALGNLQNSYYTVSFDVRIWLEGWDADTYDVIYNLNLMVSMTFKKD